ncbi:hypothetical protein H4R34_003559 [Dimargaris verticillata]|uniref:DNA mismatch repair proteins mutS family domain-containing protein n=1 Tax=Dimargaris verticillata TaxID=2761393 RepID=A0A9W8EBX3_9FUNG|nr:hypothetical protein H4R34_003559 [Dimargaris verticillata]
MGSPHQATGDKIIVGIGLKMAQLDHSTLGDLLKEVKHTIDAEKSASEGRVTIRSGVNKHLSENFELQFKTENQSYYKNSRLRDLDTTYGDVYYMYTDKEVEIVQELGIKVLAQLAMLDTAKGVATDVDCFVPASRATLGVFDKLLVRIKSIESISKYTSAFTDDLQQVVQAINECTARSLFLCDEFGKGTLAADGIGLLGASLRYFLDRPETCPKIIVVTHFHELVASNVLAMYSDRILWCTMEVSIATDQPNEPVYLYRVTPGTTLSTWAYHIAQLAGVPRAVITLAQTSRTWLGSGIFPSVEQCPRQGVTRLRLTWPTSPSATSIMPSDGMPELSVDSD